MGKITIKYYLNRIDKAKKKEADPTAPLYVQITVKSKVNRFKSQAWRFVEGLVEDTLNFTEGSLDYYLSNPESDIGKAIAIERRVIERLIVYLKPFEREDFTISEFSTLYMIASSPVRFLISDYGKTYLSRELKRSWPEVYKIIDWDNNFADLHRGLTAIASRNKSSFNEFVLGNDEVEFINITLIIFNHFADDYHNYDERFLLINWLTEDLSTRFASFLENDSPGSQEQKSKVLQHLTSIIDQNNSTLLRMSTI